MSTPRNFTYETERISYSKRTGQFKRSQTSSHPQKSLPGQFPEFIADVGHSLPPAVGTLSWRGKIMTRCGGQSKKKVWPQKDADHRWSWAKGRCVVCSVPETRALPIDWNEHDPNWRRGERGGIPDTGIRHPNFFFATLLYNYRMVLKPRLHVLTMWLWRSMFCQFRNPQTSGRKNTSPNDQFSGVKVDADSLNGQFLAIGLPTTGGLAHGCVPAPNPDASVHGGVRWKPFYMLNLMWNRWHLVNTVARSWYQLWYLE